MSIFIYVQGVSINTFDLKGKAYPLVYGGDVPNVAGGHNSSTSRYNQQMNSKFFKENGKNWIFIRYVGCWSGFAKRTLWINIQ